MKQIFRICLMLAGLLVQGLCYANSLALVNDSNFTLRAVIVGADGTQLGEFVLNPRDESSDASQLPFTVNWYCMAGAPFGVCNQVGTGSVVTAQSCGGVQECPNANNIQE
ncbi:MAG: hypothetical protein V4492_09060 [Chlamydiota bacterium]